MFLPVTMDSAERIVETIQEIKQKIPSDPFEAELILMAEMVAEQDEKSNKQDTRKEKPPSKEAERQELPAADGKKEHFKHLDLTGSQKPEKYHLSCSFFHVMMAVTAAIKFTAKTRQFFKASDAGMFASFC